MAYYSGGPVPGGGLSNRGHPGQMQGRGGHQVHGPPMGRGGPPQPPWQPEFNQNPSDPLHPNDGQYSRSRVSGDGMRGQGPLGPFRQQPQQSGGPPIPIPNTDYFLDAGDLSSNIRNDCEIILYGRSQQGYAETIEQTIKGMGLKVDIMFPKKDSKVSTFIETLNLKGTFFAVVIRPDNEKHQSVSVHVLKGVPKPEEHRNMPVRHAYTLIKDRFQQLRAKELGFVPDDIKNLLHYLIDNKPLTDIEYGKLIYYLNGRRRRAACFEATSEFEDLVGKQLQGRILNILNGGTGGNEEPKTSIPPSYGQPSLGSGMARRGGGNPVLSTQSQGRGYSPYS